MLSESTDQSHLLHEASEALSMSHGNDALEQLGAVIVPRMAEWCTVDVIDEHSCLQRIVTIHRDPGKIAVLQELSERRPVGAVSMFGPSRVMEDGIAHVMRHINDATLQDTARDNYHLGLLRQLRPTTIATIPLRVRNRVIGALTLARTGTAAPFGTDDQEALERIARVAALAVDNARMFGELKQAHASSERALELWNSMFAAAPVGLGVVDHSGALTRANTALANITGRSVRSLTKGHTQEVLGEAGDQLWALARKVFADGLPVHDVGITTVSRRGGEPRHWIVNCAPINPKADHPSSVALVISDVTTRNRAESELRHERSFLSLVLHNLDDIVTACDTDGVITVFNAGMDHDIRAQGSEPPATVRDLRDTFALLAADAHTPLRWDEYPLARALAGEDVHDVEVVFAHDAADSDASKPQDWVPRTYLCNGQTLFSEEGNKLGAVVAMHDITHRKVADMRLRSQALRDPLTGLPNRMLLLDRMRLALARSSRQQGYVAVLFVDLDGFKAVNDGLGHEVGDRCLVSIADRLTAVIRPSDTVSRIGGDEFVVLCDNVSGEDEVRAVAERMQQAVALPDLMINPQVRMSISVGMALAYGDEEPEELIRNADKAMYRAKQQGKAGHQMFDRGFRTRELDRRVKEAALRAAIEADDLRFVYQPVVSFATGDITGAEALIRYRTDHDELVPPREFLDVAEDTGLIVPVGLWGVVEACRRAREWTELRNGLRFHVYVNLSARQLRDPDLIDGLDRATQHENLPQGAVVVELQERLFDARNSSTAAQLDRVKAMGVSIGIDDFGTGQSALDHLRQHPVDVVKIDRKVVRGLGDDPQAVAVTRAVVGMATAFGITTVAEGVETEQQAELLSSFGCEMAQGYYFHSPMAAEDLTVELTSQAGRHLLI